LNLRAALLGLALASACFGAARGEGLAADRLGVVFNLDDAGSRDVAALYARRRAIPAGNVLGIHLPAGDVLPPEAFTSLRKQVLDGLPASVQSLLLVWSTPYAVGCMSITSAFAAGYSPSFCQPGCVRTPPNPLFDTPGWLPVDTVGWWPAMLLPSDDPALAKNLIERGIAADGSAPAGTVYLVRTSDKARNVRAATYGLVGQVVGGRVRVRELAAPVTGAVDDALGYFTGIARVEELTRVHFRPGALADHLTSTGGMLRGGRQMSAGEWLGQGATASYGSVSEPCAFPEKFSDIGVLMSHYLHGETALEAYWKSVAMPGQGLFIGEPLARPFGRRP
jgi:uncharacterized protein (TIGR03790 family)